MGTLLGKIFRKRPLTIKTTKAKDSKPIKVKVPEDTAPAVKISMPKAEGTPALRIDIPKSEEKAIDIKIPEEPHEPLPTELPAHHHSDAEMLSKIVEAKPAKQQPKPAAQETTTIEQVVAAIKKPAKPATPRPVASQKTAKGRKTKHDRIIASIASRSKAAPAARKRSR